MVVGRGLAASRGSGIHTRLAGKAIVHDVVPVVVRVVPVDIAAVAVLVVVVNRARHAFSPFSAVRALLQVGAIICPRAPGSTGVIPVDVVVVAVLIVIRGCLACRRGTGVYTGLANLALVNLGTSLVAGVVPVDVSVVAVLMVVCRKAIRRTRVWFDADQSTVGALPCATFSAVTPGPFGDRFGAEALPGQSIRLTTALDFRAHTGPDFTARTARCSSDV